MKYKFKIGFTIGDANGIGLEIFAKALMNKSINRLLSNQELFLFGNLQTILNYFKLLDFEFNFAGTQLLLEGLKINIVNIDPSAKVVWGAADKDSGLLAYNSIVCSTHYALEKKIDCVVTLPISKYSLKLARVDYSSHTELLSKLCGTANPLMMFVYKNFRVALLTIHIPIQSVANYIDKDNVVEKTKILYSTLQKDFEISKPKIALLGLNPHSGEGGVIGKEEMQILKPAIEELKSTGIVVEGPFPADGFFAFGNYKLFDATLACYHDQGLIPFKILSKGSGVNYTANLPIVRTSPDHGTAFNIAGKGVASPSSLIESIRLALHIAKARRS